MNDRHEFVSVSIAGQLFGIPVTKVQDVLGPQRITRVPLAPREIAGSLNLRGRIVTAIDLRVRLGLPAVEDAGRNMSVVVEHRGEAYSLVVDQVGEVLHFEAAQRERNPATLDPRWRDVSDGIYRLESTLLIVLDTERLLGFAQSAEAA